MTPRPVRPPLPSRRRPDRARPRLADRHARRREGARGPVRAVSRAPICSRSCTCRARVSPGHRAAADPPLVRVSACPLATRLLPALPAALPDGRRAVRPRRLRPRHQHQPLRGQVGRQAGPGRGTSATASRRCATRGTSSTPTSGRRASAPLASAAGAAGPGAAGAVGRRDGGPRGPLSSRSLSTLRRRIRRYYNRDAGVVYPPVDTDFFQPDGSVPGGSALIVSALVPYKRIDLAIEACRRCGVPPADRRRRPGAPRLRARSPGRASEFLGRCTDDEVRALLPPGASVVLLPGEEDFGIVPLEAQACGRPVVALARGGALETVVDGETGVLVAEPTAEAFADGIARGRCGAVRRRRRSAGTPSGSAADRVCATAIARARRARRCTRRPVRVRW